MELENILYASVQLVHNFGAAAVTGLPIAALWFKPAPPVLRKMAWLTLLAWLVQSASGAGFGTVSFFQEGELPHIDHLALGGALRENCLRGACGDPAHGSFSTALRFRSGRCQVARLGDPRGHGVIVRRHFAMVFLSGRLRHPQQAMGLA